MAEPLVVIGAGGFGREVADVVEALNARAEQSLWDLIGMVDDGLSEANRIRLADRGIRPLGSLSELISDGPRVRYVIGIGNPDVRRSIADQLDRAGFRPATLVHPEATLGSQVSLGAGTVVCAGARITTNISLGRHCHVNPNCTIGHDTLLGDFVSLNPGATVSGDCVIGARSLVGAGAVVLNQIVLGEGVLVGASACVTRNVPDATVVKGVPAR